MIEGFEVETAKLNEYERETVLPLLVKGLQAKIGKDAAVTSTTMIAGLKNMGVKASDARIRKLINHIRINGLVERLVANSNGYFVATEKEQVEKYIRSLNQRAGAINAVMEKLKSQI